MKTYRIKSLGILTFAKFQGVMGLFIGLLLGILYSFGGLILDTLVSLGWIQSTETPGLSIGTILAFGALLGMPLIFSVLGFLLGWVEAFLFNFVSRWFEGMNLKFLVKE
ncbi:hypothetical protein [Algoriphagus mannitolivorans]|uniref:hypothetical protein n=1 Tax=Algoriphagus mannitolivorans TaxID=226504 RepID=UPI000428A9AF|nr:hypothetical protein [Algoriphagus mannitolivorans]